MDRYAIFVDAGYLYDEGGSLCCDTSDRHEILLYGLGASEFLLTLAHNVSGLKPLRTYWYDISHDGVPTAAQHVIATLPNMKLCLQEVQDGDPQSLVTTAIHRDLTGLARERAICDAFVLSDNEELVAGVREAQDVGVRVMLLNVAAPDGQRNQRSPLVYEADGVVRLRKDDLARFIRRRQAPDDDASDTYDPVDAVIAAASDFADLWLERASDEEFDELLALRPRIPEALDGDLLYAVENAFGGSLRGQDRLRRAVRQAFWSHVDQEVDD